MTYNWLISDWIHWGPLERIEPAQQSWLCCNCFTPCRVNSYPSRPWPGRFFRGGHERQIMGKVQGNRITGAHRRLLREETFLPLLAFFYVCGRNIKKKYTTRYRENINKISGNIRQKKQGYRPCFVRGTPSIRVIRVGLEPTTPTLKVLCSTSWASESVQTKMSEIRSFLISGCKGTAFFWIDQIFRQ